MKSLLVRFAPAWLSRRPPVWLLHLPPAWCGGAALVVSAMGLGVDRPAFFAAWLAAWWFCLGIVLGVGTNARIHVLTGGQWGDVLAPAARALQRPMPRLLLLFLPLLAGVPVVYPWSATPAVWRASLDHPAFQEAWFSPGFFGARLASYALLWGWLTRPGRPGGHAALGLAAYTLGTSLAAVDLVMALVPGWTSTVFGWLALIGQMTAGAAASTCLAARTRPTPAPVDDAPVVWRDLGNLLLMFVMLQAYLQFMQFLIIWAENLPREIVWYVPRLQTGWRWVGLALVLLQFAAPLAALLSRRMKDDPRRLARIAGGLLAMQALGAAWLVVPSVAPNSLHVWWLLPLTFVGMTLLLFGGVPDELRGVAADRPAPWPREPDPASLATESSHG